MSQGAPLLLIDDNRDLAENLAEILRCCGHQVELAEDGFAALSLLSKARYSMVVTDLRMPGLDGVQVLEQIKTRWPELPVVIMTAFAEDELLDGVREKGAETVLCKPVNIDLLIQTIRDLVCDQSMAVLIVEDDTALQEGLLEAFCAHGVQARACDSLQGAKAILQSPDQRYRVLVIDLKLPDGDGLELGRLLPSLLPEGASTPSIIYMTGFQRDFSDGLREVLGRATVRLLEKPFDPDRLLRLVQELETQETPLI